MVSEDDDRRPARELLEPPAEAIDKLRCNALRLRVNDVTTDDNHVRAEIFELAEEILEHLGVLIVTLKTTPVNVCNMCDLDQRMLPLLMILERLIIP